MSVVGKMTLALIDDEQVFSTPAGVSLCHVGAQNDLPTIWFECEPGGAFSTEQVFRVFGTGHEVPGGWMYVGTAITHGGALVWHVFKKVAL